MALFADRISNLGTENAFKVGPHIVRVENQGNKVIKLNLGEPDFNIPDFVKAEIKRQLDQNNTHYCDPKGLPSLRKLIAKQMKEMRGLDVSPERVVVFPGGKPSIGFCQEAYCNTGDQVIYPSPGFPIYESFTRYVGATPVPMHLTEDNDFTVSGQQLSKLITEWTKLIILNFPSNPTGGVATMDQLEELAAVIKKKCPPEVRLYSDEIYEYIIFDGRKHVSIASIPGMEERTIISSGFSKTFAWTGGRIGYAVFPTEEEANVFKNLNINYFSCVPPYNQEGARLAMEHPESPAVVGEMVKTFQHRRDVIVRQLNQIDGITCRTAGGAFYLFPNIAGLCEQLGIIDAYNNLPRGLRERTSPSTMFQMFALYNHHVAVMDRNSFGKIGAEGQHYLRLSIASELSVLEEGVTRLEQASKDRSGFERFVEERGEELF
jgi:aspartate aminotransferase